MTCFFVGHRTAPDTLRPILSAAIERLITQCGVQHFVVGQYGSFDRLAGVAVKEMKEHHPKITLSLLLPYYPAGRSILLPEGFDDAFYPPNMETVPKRAAILRADCYMIQNSDYLIMYERGLIGNTRTLAAFARQREDKGKLHIENLAGK